MKKIFKAVRYLRHFLFSRFYHLGWKVALGGNVKFVNSGSIHLGEGVNIDSDCVLAVFDRYKQYEYHYKKPIIKIDENVGFGKGTIVYAVRKVHIKKNVMTGPYCFIGDYDHAYTDTQKSIVDQPLTNIRPVVVEEGSWIGVHVTIGSGVRIGKNSVVGANSVVTKDIPDYCIAVGAPARVIKKYDHISKTWKRVGQEGGRKESFLIKKHVERERMFV